MQVKPEVCKQFSLSVDVGGRGRDGGSEEIGRSCAVYMHANVGRLAASYLIHSFV